MPTPRESERPRDPLTELVIGAAIEVHRHLGPGLLESAYETSLCWELTQLGLPHARQVPIALTYKGAAMETAYRADVIVGGGLLIEIKAVERLSPVNEAQVLTYLRLARLRTGLLINFNVAVLRDGIRRLVCD